jgi:uncharacterized metal-binding protein
MEGKEHGHKKVGLDFCAEECEEQVQLLRKETEPYVICMHVPQCKKFKGQSHALCHYCSLPPVYRNVKNKFGS